MFKSMLVCTDGSAYGDTAREYGLYLAQRAGVRMTGLHVMDSRVLEGPLMADISGWVGASPYAAQLPQFRELLREKAESIAEAFRSRCRAAGVEAEVHLQMGHPATVILEESPKAELLVLGQKGEHAEFLGEILGSVADRVSRHAGRPCLLTPSAFRPIERILCAYDGSVQAGQALELAAELAVALGGRLDVLSVAQKDDGDAARAVAEEGARLARDHGAQVETITRASHRAAPAILLTAEERGCGLIALGAIGHSRIREFFLGSAAAQVAARAHLPVLLAR